MPDQTLRRTVVLSTKIVQSEHFMYTVYMTGSVWGERTRTFY